jgi:hypothetical protein
MLHGVKKPIYRFAYMYIYLGSQDKKQKLLLYTLITFLFQNTAQF